MSKQQARQGFRKPDVDFLRRRLFREGWFIVGLAFCVYLLAALISHDPSDPGWARTGENEIVKNAAGWVGAWLSDMLLTLFGYPAYCFTLLFSLRLFNNSEQDLERQRFLYYARCIGFLGMLVGACGLAAMMSALKNQSMLFGAGGVIGSNLLELSQQWLGGLGTRLVFFVFFLLGITFFTTIPWLRTVDKSGKLVVDLMMRFTQLTGFFLRLIWRITVRFFRLLIYLRNQVVLRGFNRVANFLQRYLSGSSEKADLRIVEKTLARAQSTRRSPDGLRQGVGVRSADDRQPRFGVFRIFATLGHFGVILVTPLLWVLRLLARDGQRQSEQLLQRIEPSISGVPLAISNEDGAGGADLGPHPLRRSTVVAGRSSKRGQSPLAKLKNHAASSGVVPARRRAGTALKSAASLPSLNLLDTPSAAQTDDTEAGDLEQRSLQLEQRLAEFGVRAKVSDVYPGPVITCFEIKPESGTKASKISNLANDLARSLAVPKVRVIEVVPGKSVVGIEIPNKHRCLVNLRETLSSQEFKNAGPLSLALGQDTSGETVVANLASMPHLLVAGTTGSGKSVGLNTMLISLLYLARASELRLILIDPKMLELAAYNDVPHLLTPVVTDMKNASAALSWCIGEMERRYQLMSDLGARNLESYNQLASQSSSASGGAQPQSLPYIVLVIDEFADLVMVVGKRIEELIVRIAQKARAAGIHLILATQRPSVDVITGLIKANIPARISFQVSSKTDSRTILDQGGAEMLLGHGDMLYLPPGSGMPQRVHGAFVSDGEVNRIVSACREQGPPNYLDEVISAGGAAVGARGLADNDFADGAPQDELYNLAVAWVVQSRRASISAVQRKLRIGYNRAARLIEAMEHSGVVSAMNQNGSRTVLAPDPGHAE